MSLPEIAPLDVVPDASSDLAVIFSGGGARAAYQVGLLKGLARHFPDLRFDILLGASAGGMNAVYLAALQGALAEKAEHLAEMWCDLTCDSIYHFDLKALLPFRFGPQSQPHGMVDTTPLRNFLCRVLNVAPGQAIPGIEENIRTGDLRALALLALDYSTGQTVRWVQGGHYDDYDGPNRRVVMTRFTIDHILASSALPFVFPAVQIGDSWYGDGSIRLAAPLSPAVHLGAKRILVMSTTYQRTAAEASIPDFTGYPPASAILGQLLNAIFIDVIEDDAARMHRMNELLRKLAPHERDGLTPIDLLVLRPSISLSKLAGEYRRDLPRKLQLLVRMLGARENESPDFVSLLMFEPEYTKRIIELGEADVATRLPEVRAFLGEETRLVAAG